MINGKFAALIMTIAQIRYIISDEYQSFRSTSILFFPKRDLNRNKLGYSDY